MKTEEQVTEEFTKELKALLKKWNCEIVADYYCKGYVFPDEGDTKIIAYIAGVYDKDNNCLRKYTEIDFGDEIRKD
jgi:hypothetical protein